MDIDLRRGAAGGGPPRRTNADFPACACDCLRQIDRAMRMPPYQKGRNLDLQSAVDNDVFCLAPDKRSRLTPIQELKLLDIVCSYYQEKAQTEEPRHRYAYFEVLFCGREGETALHEARVGLLAKLCSLAVQYRCDALLADAAAWLDRVPLTKPYAAQLVGRLAADLCGADAPAPLHRHLFALAGAAPSFAPYFLALAFKDARPTAALVAVAAEWLCQRPHAVLRPFVDGSKSSTLISLQKLLADQTLPQLVSLACLRSLPLTGVDDADELYDKLLNGLLNLMLAVPDSTPTPFVRVLAESQMLGLIDAIAQLDSDADGALDRAAQLLQVALVTKCYHGRRDAVQRRLAALTLSNGLFEHIFTQPI